LFDENGGHCPRPCPNQRTQICSRFQEINWKIGIDKIRYCHEKIILVFFRKCLGIISPRASLRLKFWGKYSGVEVPRIVSGHISEVVPSEGGVMQMVGVPLQRRNFNLNTY